MKTHMEIVEDYSLDALVMYCDLMAKAGQLSESKSKVWKTACRSVISGLAPELQADVRKVDVESAMSSYRANNPKAAPKTLSEYSSRLRNALTSFIEPAETQMEIPSETEPVSAPERTEVKRVEVVETSSPKKPTSSHTLNIPLRPDFVAQLLIPYDIKPVEAKRIFRMLEVLAMNNEELDS
jgi:hypothetical protein